MTEGCHQETDTLSQGKPVVYMQLKLFGVQCHGSSMCLCSYRNTSQKTFSMQPSQGQRAGQGGHCGGMVGCLDA